MKHVGGLTHLEYVEHVGGGKHIGSVEHLQLEKKKPMEGPFMMEW